MNILLMISFTEIGFIVAIVSIYLGVTAVLQNPFLPVVKKILWIVLILLTNWIGLLVYYFTFYVKKSN